MSVECDRCGEHTMECKCNNNLPDRMINAVIRLGRGQQYLENILKSEVFRDRRYDCVNDDLWFLMNILRGNDES